MSEGQISNLDIRCVELGHQIANIKGMEEKILNDTLSVLEEQGPYAMFLYVKARHKDAANCIERQTLQFLREVFGDKISGEHSVLDAVKKLAEDLDDLLLTRDLLRNALSYALYHVKARESRRR